MMKSQLLGIGTAFAISYLLFGIRHLLLTFGKNKTAVQVIPAGDKK